MIFSWFDFSISFLYKSIHAKSKQQNDEIMGQILNKILNSFEGSWEIDFLSSWITGKPLGNPQRLLILSQQNNEIIFFPLFPDTLFLSSEAYFILIGIVHELWKLFNSAKLDFWFSVCSKDLFTGIDDAKVVNCVTSLIQNSREWKQ